MGMKNLGDRIETLHETPRGSMQLSPQEVLQEYGTLKSSIEKLGESLEFIYFAEVLPCFARQPLKVEYFVSIGGITQLVSASSDSVIQYFWVLYGLLTDAALTTERGRQIVKRAVHRRIAAFDNTQSFQVEQWKQVVEYITDDYLKWQHFIGVRPDFATQTKMFLL